MQANARHMTGGDDDVQSYEVDPGSKFGWICATNLKLGLLIGYVWPAKDYPWISLWCCSREGKPYARGLEFGSTGLHQPFHILARHPELLGLPTFKYLDAQENHLCMYTMFLLEVPKDFAGVADVCCSPDTITVTEHGAAPRSPSLSIASAEPGSPWSQFVQHSSC